MNSVCFIGHRKIYNYNEVREKLLNAVVEKIKKGCKFFTMGTHGEFDRLALSVCREVRKIYKNIEIEVVITSFKSIRPIIEYDKIFGLEKYVPFDDVKTVMYEIENIYFKRQIVVSNQKMIDSCGTLICYVDSARTGSGAKAALKYALNKGLEVVNLYNC